MARRSRPSITLLRALIDYNPETGSMVRRPRPSSDFTKERLHKSWTSRFCGKDATSFFKAGYLTVQVNSQNILAHRAAFAIYHGRWPEGQIDHINGKRSDNRIVNLREVDNATNSKNTGIRSNNKTGVMGVKFEPRNTLRPWVSCIKVDGESVYLGCYASMTAAILARKRGEEKYGYHPNHGTRAAVPKAS